MYNEAFKNDNNIRDVNIVQYVNIVQCVKRKVGYSLCTENVVSQDIDRYKPHMKSLSPS